MKKYIIIAGNPSDGFHYVGPFADAETANEWADDKLRGENWWVDDLFDAEQKEVVTTEATYEGDGSRGVKLEAAFTGDPGEYHEIRVDAYAPPGGARAGVEMACVADVVVGVNADQEVRVLVTTGGNGDGDHHVIVYPERSEDIIEFD